MAAKLRERFVAALPAPLQPVYEAVDAVALEHALAQLVLVSRAARAGVSDEAFLDYLARRAPDREPIASLLTLPAIELGLACACAFGDVVAHGVLEAQYLLSLRPALLRIANAPEIIDELMQVLRIQLLLPEEGRAPGIGKYSGRGELRSWLRVVAIRELVRLQRRSRRDVPVDSDRLLETLLPPVHPDRRLAGDRDDADVKAAFELAVAALEPKERLLLRQHVIDELNIDELGALYRVHRATAFRWVEKARRRLVAGTRRQLMRKLSISGAEADSLLRLSLSRLNLSLARLFEAE